MKTSVIRRTVVLGLPATTVLAACGQASHDSSNSATGGNADASTSVTGPPANAAVDRIPAIEPKIWGRQYFPRSGSDWLTPDGQPTGLVYDESTGIHTVPSGAPPIGERLFVAEPSLYGGTEYELALVDASPPTLMLRLTPLENIDHPSTPLPLPGGPVVARPAAPAVFSLPASTDPDAPFANNTRNVRLQYECDDPAGATFRIGYRQQTRAGENLIELAPTWYTWNGDVQPAVEYQGKYGQIWIQPRAGGGVNQAIQRYTSYPAFRVGKPYELKIRSAQPGCIGALFFFDANDQLVPVDGAGWVQGQPLDAPAASSGVSTAQTRFAWPDRVAYFVLQVSGAWNSRAVDIVWVTLVEVASEA